MNLIVKTKILINLDNYSEDKNYIVFTVNGMSTIVLIGELHKLYPNDIYLGIYLDIGSDLDCICTKRDSRGLVINITTYIVNLTNIIYYSHKIIFLVL